MKIKAVIIFFLLSGASVFAQELLPSEDGYKLVADSVFGTEGVYFTARGNVMVTFRNSILKADEATYYPGLNIIEATGNVVVKDEIQELYADRVTYDLSTETGIIDNATGTIEGEYYVCAQYIHRLGKEYYMMEQARITTCSAPIPDWSFSFHKVSAEIDGYMVGDHATANVKDFPIMYTPKLFFPLKVTRQTGLLIPRLGHESEVGTYIGEQFFWALDYDKDITFGINAYTDRGVQGGIEGRYAISPDSRIYLATEGINDSDSSAENDGRWRYVSKSVVRMPHNLEVLADADIVSDFMYMRDFGSYSIYDDGMSHRENVFYQQYHMRWYTRWADTTLMFRNDTKYKDIDTTTEQGYRQTTLNQQPSLNIQKYNMDLRAINFDYSLWWNNVLYTDYRYRFDEDEDKNELKYGRLHGMGSFYKSLNFNLFNVTPSVTGYYTRWMNFSEPQDIHSDSVSSYNYLVRNGDGYERFIPEFSVKVDVNEIFRLTDTSKHSILNTLEFRYIEELDQEGLPFYLNEDEIEPVSELSWHMRNYFRTGNLRGQLFLKQAVDFYDKDKPWKPLELEGSINYLNYIRDTLELTFDYYPSNSGGRNGTSLASVDNTLTVNLGRYKIYNNYIYTRDIYSGYNTTLEAGVDVKIRNVVLHTMVLWRGHNDFLSVNQVVPIENEIGLEWHDQCWTLGVLFSSEKYRDTSSSGREMKRNYKIELALSLRGLGDYSTGVYSDSKIYEDQ